MNAKRLLFLTHRWLGISLFILILVWLLSGLVMMYVGYPKLTPEERLAHGSPLGMATCCQGVGRAMEQLASDGAGVTGLRLFDHGQATLVAVLADKTVRAFDGATGNPLAQTGPDIARRNAEKFLNGVHVFGAERVTEDAWTHTRLLDPYRPFYRVDTADGDIAHLYVSALTGEVMRDVTRVEKTWNWVGAWLHWLYMFRGGVLDGWWSDILIWLSFGTFLLACSGLIAGILRWRRKGYKNGQRSPYNETFRRLHHVLGLVFGVFLITWLLSGFFSMNPAKVFSSRSQAKLVQGIQASELRQLPDIAQVLDCMRSAGFTPVELEWLKTPGSMDVLGVDKTGRSLVYRDSSPQHGNKCILQTHYAEDELLAMARQALPSFAPAHFRQQNDYDWHYYPRAVHSLYGQHARPLPVFVVSFDDPESTSLYIDYQTGRILQRTDDRQKSMRVLFKFLHSFDWYPLLASRPGWDIFLIAASLGGLVIALTGSVLVFRRLRRRQG